MQLFPAYVIFHHAPQTSHPMQIILKLLFPILLILPLLCPDADLIWPVATCHRESEHVDSPRDCGYEYC